MDSKHILSHQEGATEDVLPVSAQEVQPTQQLRDPFLPCSNPVCSTHIYHCLVLGNGQEASLQAPHIL